MKHTYQKFVSGLLALCSSLVLSGAGLATTAFASTLTESKATLSNVVSKASSTHTIAFKVATAGAIRKIKFEYVIAPSGAGASTVPDEFAATPVIESLTIAGGADDKANWGVVATGGASAGVLTYTRTGDTDALTQGNEIILQTSGISNNDATIAGAGQCDAVANSESCYIKISTLTAADALIDNSVTTYTVISNITVSATVDPILTFTVTGVNSANVAGNETEIGTCTAVTSTATQINFLNVTVGTPKCGQQGLAVKTNALNGYSIYNRFTGAEIMAGTVDTNNNIDPFTGNAAGWLPDAGTPGAWTTPGGNAKNVNSGWLGVRATEQSGYNFANDAWSPASNAAGTGKRIMFSTGPDLGTAATYVSYKIEVNALQPADTYSGSMVYNVVASY